MCHTLELENTLLNPRPLPSGWLNPAQLSNLRKELARVTAKSQRGGYLQTYRPTDLEYFSLSRSKTKICTFLIC